jgi:hypothetical protein
MEGGLVKTRPLRPLEAVRAFGMMLAGSIALAASAAASIAAVARASLSLRRPRPLALLGTAATAFYAFVIRPWHLHWGAEPEDETRALPGDARAAGRRASVPRRDPNPARGDDRRTGR